MSRVQSVEMELECSRAVTQLPAKGELSLCHRNWSTRDMVSLTHLTPSSTAVVPFSAQPDLCCYGGSPTRHCPRYFPRIPWSLGDLSQAPQFLYSGTQRHSYSHLPTATQLVGRACSCTSSGAQLPAACCPGDSHAFIPPLGKGQEASSYNFLSGNSEVCHNSN